MRTQITISFLAFGTIVSAAPISEPATCQSQTFSLTGNQLGYDVFREILAQKGVWSNWVGLWDSSRTYVGETLMGDTGGMKCSRSTVGDRHVFPRPYRFLLYSPDDTSHATSSLENEPH